ncbi:MAG: UDP-N-acetylmuramate dehydrogenase [Eubacteriales bacterium]|nr:UDP-N-acetylmuramate dehydrogenase [Eubacteriales bacterium]
MTADWTKERALLEKLEAIVGKEQVLLQEPMKKHTTFRIGGPADLFLQPTEIGQVAPVLEVLRAAGVPGFILGNGSNLLVSDSGFRGAVVQLDHKLQKLEMEGSVIRAEAGVLLSRLAACARDHALTGLEFASGIPGTLGGACTMNAGAYGGEMKQVLKNVTILDENLQMRTIPAEELELGYRTSRIQKGGWIVLAAEIELQQGDQAAIIERMDELKEARVTKQPLEYPSAGSTFKRPEGYFAGKLIQDAGLRGYQVGGAAVSEKHCGFVINRENATAADVCQLIRDVQKIVYEKFAVELETEIRFLGFE